MAQEKFFQRLRSGESPQDVGRVTHTGQPVHKRLTDDEKNAITKKFMNTPVYPSRLRGKGLRATRGGKPLPHPMRSAE